MTIAEAEKKIRKIYESLLCLNEIAKENKNNKLQIHIKPLFVHAVYINCILQLCKQANTTEIMISALSDKPISLITQVNNMEISLNEVIDSFKKLGLSVETNVV